MDQCQQGVAQFNLQDAINQAEEAMQQEVPIAPAPALAYIPPLDVTEFQCDQIDPTIYQKKGVLLQICNTNASAHATIIGGIRLAVEDIRRIPAYVQRYRTNIKKVAVRVLNRHLQESQCSVGLHETLSLDDYCMTFTVATLSQRARQLNPHNRGEAPLFYCLLPGMLEPVILMANEDGTYQTGHIVNLYIHLLPAHHRRVVLARKQDKPDADSPIDGPISKKQRPNFENNPRPERSYDNRPYEDRRHQNYDNRKLMSQVAELVDKRLTTATLATAFPPLPTTKAPSWNIDDNEDLPEN